MAFSVSFLYPPWRNPDGPGSFGRCHRRFSWAAGPGNSVSPSIGEPMVLVCAGIVAKKIELVCFVFFRATSSYWKCWYFGGKS